MIRQKVKNILLVAPSLDWAASERLLLRDAISYIDNGLKVFALVIRDSFLHYRLQKLGVEIIFHKTGVVRWWNWKTFNYLETEIAGKEIDVVHTVGQTYLWSLAHLLRDFKLVVFIASIPPGAKLEKHWADGIFYRRVDRFIVTSPSSQSILSAITNVSLRKIEYFPFGPFWNPLNESEVVLRGKRGLQNFATYLPVHHHSIEPLKPILLSFKAIIDFYPKHELYLRIYSLKNWKENILHNELQNLLWELEISEKVKLITEEMRDAAFFNEIDLWLSPHFEEFDDLIIPAISAGVPSIAPRCETVMSLQDQSERVARSCKRGDARDLRVQMIEMIENYPVYVQGTRNFCHRLSGFLVYGEYQKKITRLADTLLVMRARKFREYRT